MEKQLTQHFTLPLRQRLACGRGISNTTAAVCCRHCQSSQCCPQDLQRQLWCGACTHFESAYSSKACTALPACPMLARRSRPQLGSAACIPTKMGRSSDNMICVVVLGAFQAQPACGTLPLTGLSGLHLPLEPCKCSTACCHRQTELLSQIAIVFMHGLLQVSCLLSHKRGW